MAVKRVLVVPSHYISTLSRRELVRVKLTTRHLLSGRLRQAREAWSAHMLCTEVYHYGDLPKVLGRENVLVVGSYYDEYLRQDLPDDTRYPSLHKTPLPRFVSASEALAQVPEVDAVVIGMRSGPTGEKIRNEALKRGIFVAILDYFDHLEVYQNDDSKVLTRGLEYGRDFNLFMKHDIPLGKATRTLRPIAPMPVRVESYPQTNKPLAARSVAAFYRGQKRLGVLREDRTRIADLVQNAIPGALIENQEQLRNSSVHDYWTRLAASKVALSPAGKVWDSTRHTEVAMFGCVPLIPEPNCETVNHLVRDGENAIAYRTRQISAQTYELLDGDACVERVRSLLNEPSALERLGGAWRSEVMAHHTTEARARYLVKCIAEAKS